VFSVLKVVVILVVLITLETTLALLFLGLLPCLFLVLWFTNKYVEKNFMEFKKLNDAEMGIVEHDFQRLEQIKLNNLASLRFESFAGLISKYARRTVILNTLTESVKSAFELICNVFMVILLFIGINMVIQGRLTVGSLIAFYGYF